MKYLLIQSLELQIIKKKIILYNKLHILIFKKVYFNIICQTIIYLDIFKVLLLEVIIF